MNALLVSDAQAALIRQSKGLELRDAQGNCLGYVVPLFSADEIELARQRRTEPGPRLTTREVLEKLEDSTRP